MDYFANPVIPENLDGSREGHGRDFVKILLKALALLAAFLIAIDLLSRLLAPFVPFSWEEALVPDFPAWQSAGAEAELIEKELNQLAGRLAVALDLPPEMRVTVHYQDDPTVNAMASFGGHVIVFRGLLEGLESEDALAAVLAHEVAHIRHRDVLKGLMRAVSLAVLTAALDSSSAGSALGETVGGFGLMSYSRGQESAADAAATVALGRLYGHTQGFEDCFLYLLAAQEGLAAQWQKLQPELLSTHPDTLKRIKRSQALARELGLPVEGQRTPLPLALRLNDDDAEAGPDDSFSQQ